MKNQAAHESPEPPWVPTPIPPTPDAPEGIPVPIDDPVPPAGPVPVGEPPDVEPPQVARH